MTDLQDTAKADVRHHFNQWFDESAEKDLDAVMRRIAPEVISYEHVDGLVHRGVDAVRAVCQRGFELQDGRFRWDVPDLEVLVRDDIAVTWGLNRMVNERPDGERIEMWSRGTRILQRIDGHWLMIHQHVSFPVNPETGEALTELR